MHRCTALSLVCFVVIASAIALGDEPRPFAPLPLQSQMTFRSRVLIYAGYTTQSLRASNGTECELRLQEALTKDLGVGPETPLKIIGGSVQRLRWNGLNKTVTRFRSNEIGETAQIAEYSQSGEVVRRIRFASAMAAYGGRPDQIAATYRIGGLMLQSAAGDSLSLLCSKGYYVSGGTFPGIATLADTAELFDVKLAD